MGRPMVDHIYFLSEADGRWHSRTFLPIFDDKIAWAEEVNCPPHCMMACHAHPMIEDEDRRGMYHVLCTLTVIGAGLITRKEILGKGL